MKKLRFLALYSLYLLAALALIDYFFFYRPYVRELRTKKGTLAAKPDLDESPLIEVRHVEPALMKRLGRLATEKKSSFVDAEVEKAPGVVRVCAFGDSFTYGDEVDAEHDYPSLLQRRFEAAGARNVEVLNFGVSGFGFHQTYMLWDGVGRRFSCDFTLLGPQGFQPIRDTTFGFIHHWTPYYLHARYVLDGGDVRLVEIPGDTYGARFDRHFSFIPRWDVLRYDRNPPMFLRSLIPRDRELKNPFYYDSRSMDEEAFDSYAILLGKMAAGGERILVGHYVPEVVDVAREVGVATLAAADLHEEGDFPYRATIDHASPFGNRLVAEQFFRWLTGEADPPLEVLESIDVAGDAGPAPSGWEPGALAFNAATRLGVELDGVEIGAPVISAVDLVEGEQAFAARSILALKGTETSLADACLIAFDGDLRPGMSVVLGTASGAELPVATVVPLDPRIQLGVVEIEGLQFPNPWQLFFRGNPRARAQQFGGGELTLRVDGREVLRGTAAAWVCSTVPISARPGSAAGFSRNLGGLLELADLPETGRYDLVIEPAGAAPRRLPLRRSWP
ncbi:MAG: hypothetical protein HC897_10590, partial [Thermoanaerobaculia bacterium]|nr:hypothetical protein [Thermoanaerobaculia bacterium]